MAPLFVQECGPWNLVQSDRYFDSYVKFESPQAYAFLGVTSGWDMGTYFARYLEEPKLVARARRFQGLVAYLIQVQTKGTQGAGHGSRMLDYVLSWVDVHGVRATFLLAVPSGPLDQMDLMAWYGRRGFIETPRDPGPPGTRNNAMIRKLDGRP